MCGKKKSYCRNNSSCISTACGAVICTYFGSKCQGRFGRIIFTLSHAHRAAGCPWQGSFSRFPKAGSRRELRGCASSQPAVPGGVAGMWTAAQTWSERIYGCGKCSLNTVRRISWVLEVSSSFSCAPSPPLPRLPLRTSWFRILICFEVEILV